MSDGTAGEIEIGSNEDEFDVMAREDRELGDALQKIEKLEAFKSYVHKRLDDAGVPSDPEPEANAEHGCRIGGRLNWLIASKEDQPSNAANATKDVILKILEDATPKYNRELQRWLESVKAKIG